MAEDGPSRNFRSAYYEKLGFCGNDEKNYLDLLIASSPFDPEELIDLCERFELDRKCVEAWKILLGVECGRQNPFDEFANVRRVRTEHFRSLKHHLEVLLRYNLVIKDRLKKVKLLENAETNPGSLITLMYLLEAGRLETSDIDCCRKLSAMATFFENVSGDLQEAFFLFRNFTNKMNKP